MSRFGDFCVHDNNITITEPIALPLVHALRVIIIMTADLTIVDERYLMPS